MGAAASIQNKLDEATVRQVAGAFFDQAKFDEMKDENGLVSVEQLLSAAAATVERMDEKTVRLLAGDQFDETFFNNNKELDGTIATGHLFLALGLKPPELSDDELKKRCYEDGSYLQFATPEQQDNITVAITAVCNRGSALQFCSPRLRDDVRLVKLALKFDGTNIGFASERLQQDPEIVSLALELLPSYSMKWEAVQLAAKMYSKDFDALQQAKIALRGDAEVIKVVVAENGLGLKYAMPYVRHEREVVKMAIQQNSQAVFYASPISLVVPCGSKDAIGPVDPEMLALIEECHARENRDDPKTGWCPDPASVEKSIARFPELAKFSPPPEWLTTAAERVAKQEAEREEKRRLKREKREAEEKDAAWKAGLEGAKIDETFNSGEAKQSEAKD